MGKRHHMSFAPTTNKSLNYYSTALQILIEYSVQHIFFFFFFQSSSIRGLTARQLTALHSLLSSVLNIVNITFNVSAVQHYRCFIGFTSLKWQMLCVRTSSTRAWGPGDVSGQLVDSETKGWRWCRVGSPRWTFVSRRTSASVERASCLLHFSDVTPAITWSYIFFISSRLLIKMHSNCVYTLADIVH